MMSILNSCQPRPNLIAGCFDDDSNQVHRPMPARLRRKTQFLGEGSPMW